jgi:hypothetical protein
MPGLWPGSRAVGHYRMRHGRANRSRPRAPFRGVGARIRAASRYSGRTRHSPVPILRGPRVAHGHPGEFQMGHARTSSSSVPGSLRAVTRVTGDLKVGTSGVVAGLDPLRLIDPTSDFLVTGPATEPQGTVTDAGLDDAPTIRDLLDAASTARLGKNYKARSGDPHEVQRAIPRRHAVSLRSDERPQPQGICGSFERSAPRWA